MPTSEPNQGRPLEFHFARRFNEIMGIHMAMENQPATDLWAAALLEDALQFKASDLHIEPGALKTRVRLRVDGVLHDVAILARPAGQHLVSYFKVISQLDAMALAHPEHGHASVEVGTKRLELRTTVVPTAHGEMLGVRLLNAQRTLMRLPEAGMAGADQEILHRWLSENQGMLLVCGPVGSGKTSTLYAILHELQSLPGSIVTAEDPVECDFEGITQMEVNPKRGLHFPEAIRAMLRLDPDYLLIGEIRDPESAHMAITAAGSGQALLSTIHARDAVGAVTALRNYGVKNWEISAALEVSTAQRLVRRVCQRCRVLEKVTALQKEWFTAQGLPAPESLWTSVGCDSCANTGYDGRLGVFELWRITAEERALILQGADETALRKYAMNHGMHSLLRDGLEKAASGLTTLAEIRPLIHWTG